jgi:hypothetical protein
VTHLLRFSRTESYPAGRVLKEWFPLVYGVTCSVLANWAAPHWSVTNPLLLIAIGLPLVFPRLVLLSRTDIGATRRNVAAISGVVMVLIGVVWFLALSL